MNEEMKHKLSGMLRDEIESVIDDHVNQMFLALQLMEDIDDGHITPADAIQLEVAKSQLADVIEKVIRMEKQMKKARYTQRTETPYERTRRMVYATGNKWAIENFEATHN